MRHSNRRPVTPEGVVNIFSSRWFGKGLKRVHRQGTILVIISGTEANAHRSGSCRDGRGNGQAVDGRNIGDTGKTVRVGRTVTAAVGTRHGTYGKTCGDGGGAGLENHPRVQAAGGATEEDGRHILADHIGRCRAGQCLGDLEKVVFDGAVGKIAL